MDINKNKIWGIVDNRFKRGGGICEASYVVIRFEVPGNEVANLRIIVQNQNTGRIIRGGVQSATFSMAAFSVLIDCFVKIEYSPIYIFPLYNLDNARFSPFQGSVHLIMGTLNLLPKGTGF